MFRCYRDPVRSDRAFCGELHYQLLFRWFLDLGLMEPSFDPTAFTKNRRRLLRHEFAQRFFDEVARQAASLGLPSDEHFMVDGTLIEASASLKSFRPRDKPPSDTPHDDPGNPTINFQGQRRSNATHQSATDPEALLAKKGRAKKRTSRSMGHALMDNRTGLVVDFQLTQASGTDERDMAPKLVDEARVRGFHPRTLPADKSYDTRDGVAVERSTSVASRGVLWGLIQGTHTPIVINLFRNPPLTDADVAVFARVRQGKSFLLKLIARRFLATHGAGTRADDEGRGGRCVVVDAEAKQEYRPLCQGVGGQYIRLGPGSPVRINPFDLPPFDLTDDDLRDPLRDHIASLQRLMQLLLADRGHTLTGEEVAILDLALAATYANEWHGEVAGEVRGGFTSDPRTHRHERTPLMADLLYVLWHAEKFLPPVSPELVQSLATRLARYVEGSLADFFGEPTNVPLDARLTVFNVSALGEELWPVGLHLIEQFVWTQVRSHYVQGAEEPCLLVVDELWLRSAEGGAFLETVARKGPKDWPGLAVASQETADCLNSAHGLAIVHNSSTHVLLAMDRGALRVATEAFDLKPNEVASLGRAVPGQALVLCAGERLFLDVVASPAEQELFDPRPSEQADLNRERRGRSQQLQLQPVLAEPQ